MSSATTAVVGREAELERIEGVLAASDTPPAVAVVEGSPGIGKTTVWRTCVVRASAIGVTVLSSAPSQPEQGLAFGGLSDLLAAQIEALDGSLPSPQLSALRVALRLDDPSNTPIDASAIAFATLGALKALSRDAPLLVAVDDVQWLDQATADALAFAARRVREHDVRLLLTRRIETGALGSPSLQRALDECGAVTLHLGRLSVGALARILNERFSATYPRPLLHKLHETSGGNPLYALELARALGTSTERLRPREELPVPPSLTMLVERRLEGLPTQTREVLEVVSALPRPTLEVVRCSLERDPTTDLEPAVAEHMIELDEEAVRFAHPLFAAAVYDLMTAPRRAWLHRRLANVVASVEERGRHLARAGGTPDAAVADAVEEAARRTHSRGARIACAELFEAAARLTPLDDEIGRARRTLAAAASVYEAGDTSRARELLEPLVTEAPTREQRAEAGWRLGLILADSSCYDAADRLWADAVGVSDQQARVAELRRGMAVMAMYSGRTREALEQATAALTAAETSGDAEQTAYALSTRAWAGLLSGETDTGPLLARAIDLEERLDSPTSMWSPSTMAAECARFSLDLNGARVAYPSIRRVAVELGNVELEWWATFGEARTELSAGDVRAATPLVSAVIDLGEALGRLELPTRTLGYELDGLLGRWEIAVAELGPVSDEAAALGEVRWQRQACAALGRVTLAEGDMAAAAEAFAEARRLASEAGMRHPALFLALADEVEAAVEAGHLQQADDALAAVVELGVAPSWVEPVLMRASAVRAAADGDRERSVTALCSALDRSESRTPPFHHARTLLALGRIERRLRRRKASRAHLEQAAALFEENGATLWADHARREVARIGGRRPSPNGLTPTEQRVAYLVAEGKSNKEVAAVLIISVHTVEAALTSIYRKLDVRSRTELTRELAGQSKH